MIITYPFFCIFHCFFYIFYFGNIYHIYQCEKESSTVRGIITQLQMLISVYLVLRENKAGYITAVFINVYSMVLAIIFLIRNTSSAPLPGLISYLGVFIIINLIFKYKRKTTDYI